MPWLVILLALGMIVSSVVGIFEKVVTNLPIIMCFQSLILDMAGNVGTQSLAVTIRVLMDESLTAKQKFELVLKEMKIGLLQWWCTWFNVICTDRSVHLYYQRQNPYICICSIWMHWFIPASRNADFQRRRYLHSIVFQKIHIDPAVASGPLITTINDLVAVISYYGLSWIFLIEVLHLAG